VRPIRTRRVAAAVGAAVAAVCLAAAQPTTAPTRRSQSLVGRPAPDVTLTTLDGRDVSLADLRGDDVLLIEFFASWCTTCPDQVGELNEVYEALRERGLRVVGVGFGESREGVEAFVRTCGDTPPAYPLYLDPERTAEQAFRVVGVPLTVIVSREGVIRYYDHHLPEDAAETLARYLTTGELEAPRGVLGRVGEAFRSLLAAQSLWAIPVAFVGGVLSVLLPCVYPVIPVAAAFFGAQAGGSKRRAFVLALAYALGIALLVATLGLLALVLKTSVGRIAANPWVNVGVGAAIVLLSLSVIGVVHLRTPSALGRAQGRAAAMRGVPASFLLGVVSGPVVSVCVAPILGSILLAMQGNVAFGTLLLFLYGLGLGTPFVVLGTFTGLLKSIPKPGRWMRAVQVAFGVLLALVGLYFLVGRGIMRL